MTDQHQPSTSSPPDQTNLPDWLEDLTGDKSPHAGHSGEPVQQRFSTFGITATLLIIGLLSVIGYALYQRTQGTPTEGPAPKFSVTTFGGQDLKLSELKGSAVVVNFWASYCAPCRIEAPMLERVWRDYADQNVVFLGVNTDDIESDALAYLEEFDITYHNAPDKGGYIEDDYRITGIPETFVINTDGEIVRHFLSMPSEADLRAEIDRAKES